jgi:hypothetical protein
MIFIDLSFMDKILNILSKHVDKKEKVHWLFCIKIKSYGNLGLALQKMAHNRNQAQKRY